MYVKLRLHFGARGKNSQGVFAGITAILAVTATNGMVYPLGFRIILGDRKPSGTDKM